MEFDSAFLMTMSDETLNETPATETPALILTPAEIRVLGCLIEKQATTPDQYPLTVKSTQAAANQKTSRDPMMNITQGDTHYALKQLTDKKLARHVSSVRSERYEHRGEQFFDVTRPQLMLLALLMLRGPQTASELHIRSERMHTFANLDDVTHQVERLIQKSLVATMPRRPGQRGERYTHLLGGRDVLTQEGFDDSFDSDAPHAAPSGRVSPLAALEERVAALEAQMAALLGQSTPSMDATDDEASGED